MYAQPALLSLTVLGPVQWYSKWLLHDEIRIDIAEHYVKQTWRNRYCTDGANGTQMLSIPVMLPSSHTPVKDVVIDAHTQWPLQHWRSIQSAYGKSAYWEYYADYFAPFYKTPLPHRLIDISLPLLDLTLRLLKLNTSYTLTEAYEKAPAQVTDYRTAISPKIPFETDAAFQPQHYTQVFSDRFPFRPNLSIIDLLCNTGPAAADYLRQSIITP
ncbi:MAG: WbqC family protein [Bacteroidetes bacterium]|nr:WbqC family protein [Bacteroidota bacterium]